jgi:hypothetical protein
VWKLLGGSGLTGASFDLGSFLVSCGLGSEVDGAEDVVGENGEGHLGFCSLGVAGEEASACHHPLDRSERMLNGAASFAHHLSCCPCGHAVAVVVIEVRAFSTQPEQSDEA